MPFRLPMIRLSSALWTNGKTMAALAGQIVRIGVRLTNGRIYAIKGEFESKTVVEARKIINSN